MGILEAVRARPSSSTPVGDRPLRGGRYMFVADCRTWARLESGPSDSLLAIAGDRLALQHVRWTRSEADVARSRVENLSLTEVDAEGRLSL